MAKEYVGKTSREAIDEGLKDLGITEEQAEIEVLDEGAKGKLFGLGAKMARVTVAKKKTSATAAAEFLDGLFEIIKVKATTDIEEDSAERIVINLITTDSSSLIGYRGEVLDSLQCLAGAIANKGKEEYLRVVVDCENYRGKREKTLKNLAEKLADKAIKSGRKISLEPMNPYERRIIHATLVDNEHVSTVSEGKDPNRYIAIIPDTYDPTKPDRRDRKFGDRNDRGGRKFGDRNNRDRNGASRGFGGSGNRGDRGGRPPRGGSGAKPERTGFGGVYLGNSRNSEASVSSNDTSTDN